MKKFYKYFKDLCLNSSWQKVQLKYKDIPGTHGILLRQKKYKRFFYKFGENITIHDNVFFENPDKIVIDDNVAINRGCHINGSGGVMIGVHTLIGPYTFITSANHGLYHDTYFFKGSSYDYRSVKLDEHCLISAHVRILPGAQIESGSFVASGAVVTRSLYPQNSFICGVPAQIKTNLVDTRKSKPSADNLCQDICVTIFIFQEELFDCFKSFFLTLGLPQVICINDISNISNNCEEIIILSTDEDKALFYKKKIEDIRKNVNIWTPKLFNHVLCDSVEHYLKFEEKSGNAIIEKRAIIPKQLTYKTAPSKNSGAFSLDNLFAVSCKYTWRFFEKSSAISIVDLLYGFYLAEQLSQIDSYFAEKLKKAISNHLSYNDLEAEKERLFQKEGDNFAQHDLELLNLICKFQPEAVKTSYALIKSRIIRNDTTSIVCCYGLLAHYYGYDDLYKLAYEKLIRQNYCHKAKYMLVKENGSSYYYRPLLALFLYVKCNEKLNFQKILDTKTHQIDWSLNFTEAALCIELDNFVFPLNKEYSISLVLNTLLALTPFNCSVGREFVINESNYITLVPVMQKLWFLLLKKIILSKENLCIELLPWPDNKQYAVSLRYDVDRAVSFKRILEITHDIKYKWGSPCASWYFFSADSSKEKKRLLKSYHHEIGLHSLGNCEVDKETGITFHSGSFSNYWTGLKKYNKKIPLYTEFLQIQTSRPTIVFKNKQPFMVTPLHFPMELSTTQNHNSSNSQNLKIFFTERIKEQIEFGGHIILASHPDIEDNNINFYLKKFSLNQGWCSSINNVVRRIKDIYFDSLVKIYRDRHTYYIRSEINLINLTINLHYSNNIINVRVLDLKAKSMIEVPVIETTSHESLEHEV